MNIQQTIKHFTEQCHRYCDEITEVEFADHGPLFLQAEGCVIVHGETGEIVGQTSDWKKAAAIIHERGLRHTFEWQNIYVKDSQRTIGHLEYHCYTLTGAKLLPMYELFEAQL